VVTRRIVALVLVVVAAAVLVGLSAAASTSLRSDAPRPAKASPKSAEPAAQPGQIASRPTGEQQTPDDVARYWTKERMRDATPMAKTVPGGTPSPAAAPTGKGTPAGTLAGSPGRKQPAAKPTKTTARPDDVATGPSTNGNAGDGWTQEEMDNAQPLGPTVDGGEPAGNADAPGGGVGAGTP
jgi:hypothetical protein